MFKTAFKVVLAGPYVKTQRYKYPIAFGYQRLQKSKLPDIIKPERTKEQIQKCMQDSIYRAKQTLRNLVATNSKAWINPLTSLPYKPLFLTFTFKENVTELKQANYEFTKFIQRLAYDQKFEPKYLTVPEIQTKRLLKYGVAVWHFHSIFFNIPKLPLQRDGTINTYFQTLWGQGFVFNKPVNDINHLANYVAKYLTKDFTSEHDFKNQKRYFCSKGLIKPTVLRHQDHAEQVFKNLPLSADNIYSKKSVMWDGQNTVQTDLYKLWDEEDTKEMLNISQKSQEVKPDPQTKLF